jgi:hypothetical protein
MRRAFTAGVAWGGFILTVFTIISCRTVAPESIAAGETCFRCRHVIVDARLAAEMLNDNLPTKYRSPRCLARYIKAHPGEDMQIWVTDYATGAMIDPAHAWFVPVLVNDTTGERDFRAYELRSVADRTAQALGTGAVRWSTVLDRANSDTFF